MYGNIHVCDNHHKYMYKQIFLVIVKDHGQYLKIIQTNETILPQSTSKVFLKTLANS